FSLLLLLHYHIFLFFFHDPATTEIYTLSLHDALPIYGSCPSGTLKRRHGPPAIASVQLCGTLIVNFAWLFVHATGPLDEQPGERSEEHTSELQSRENLVCRLLLEKKKKIKKKKLRKKQQPLKSTKLVERICIM